MREDCCHYESRTYEDDGEVARFCTLGLAPEAPWRCPENCAKYERIALIDGDMTGLRTPPVEDEPEEPAEDVGALLADAERVVGDVEAEVLADVRPTPKRSWWRRRRGGGDDDDGFHLSNR